MPTSLCASASATNASSQPGVGMVSLFRKTRNLPAASAAAVLHATPKPCCPAVSTTRMASPYDARVWGVVSLDASSTTRISVASGRCSSSASRQAEVRAERLCTGMISERSAPRADPPFTNKRSAPPAAAAQAVPQPPPSEAEAEHSCALEGAQLAVSGLGLREETPLLRRHLVEHPVALGDLLVRLGKEGPELAFARGHLGKLSRQGGGVSLS